MQFLAETVAPAALSAVPAMLQSQRQHARELDNAAELHAREVHAASELHARAIRQAAELHDATVTMSSSLHGAALAHADTLHSDAKGLSLQLHLQQLQQELRLHRQQMRVTLDASRRENLRDVWSQKSRKAETLLITTTLMFGCFFALVVEGLPETTTASYLITAYSSTISVAFMSLIVCMLFTMRYQAVMTNYNIYDETQRYRCNQIHTDFESYYRCHCAFSAWLANRSFVVGTGALVLSAGLLCWSRFVDRYDNVAAALVYSIATAATLVFVIGSQVFARTQTRLADDGAVATANKKATTLDGMMARYTQADDSDVMDAPRVQLEHEKDLHAKQVRREQRDPDRTTPDLYSAAAARQRSSASSAASSLYAYSTSQPTTPDDSSTDDSSLFSSSNSSPSSCSSSSSGSESALGTGSKSDDSGNHAPVPARPGSERRGRRVGRRRASRRRKSDLGDGGGSSSSSKRRASRVGAGVASSSDGEDTSPLHRPYAAAGSRAAARANSARSSPASAPSALPVPVRSGSAISTSPLDYEGGLPFPTKRVEEAGAVTRPGEAPTGISGAFAALGRSLSFFGGENASPAGAGAGSAAAAAATATTIADGSDSSEEEAEMDSSQAMATDDGSSTSRSSSDDTSALAAARRGSRGRGRGRKRGRRNGRVDSSPLPEGVADAGDPAGSSSSAASLSVSHSSGAAAVGATVPSSATGSSQGDGTSESDVAGVRDLPAAARVRGGVERGRRRRRRRRNRDHHHHHHHHQGRREPRRSRSRTVSFAEALTTDAEASSADDEFMGQGSFAYADAARAQQRRRRPSSPSAAEAAAREAASPTTVPVSTPPPPRSVLRGGASSVTPSPVSTPPPRPTGPPAAASSPRRHSRSVLRRVTGRGGRSRDSPGSGGVSSLLSQAVAATLVAGLGAEEPTNVFVVQDDDDQDETPDASPSSRPRS